MSGQADRDDIRLVAMFNPDTATIMPLSALESSWAADMGPVDRLYAAIERLQAAGRLERQSSPPGVWLRLQAPTRPHPASAPASEFASGMSCRFPHALFGF